MKDNLLDFCFHGIKKLLIDACLQEMKRKDKKQQSI